MHLYNKHVYVDEYVMYLYVQVSLVNMGSIQEEEVSPPMVVSVTRQQIHFTSVHTRAILVSLTQSFLTKTTFLVAEKLTSYFISTVKSRN